MDEEDLESNLNALRQLYGLVRKDGFSRNLTCDMLDDKSRLLLKNILDLAAEKVFHFHSEIREGQGGLSLTKCTNNALELGEAWKKLTPALLDPPETSTVCGNNPDDADFTQLDREFRFIDPASQRPFTKPIMSVSASGFGNGHKYCRICQQPIAGNSTEVSRVSGVGGGVKIITGFDCTPGGIESADSCTDMPTTTLVGSEFASELTVKSTQESKDLDNLSKQASDVIKQIEMCILDLQRGSGNSALSGNILAPMHCEDQQQLPDMVTDFAPKAETACSVVQAKSLQVTGNEPSQTLLSARCKNDSSTSLPKLRNMNASQPPNLLPRTIERCTDLAKSQYVQSETANLSEENMGQNQMADAVFSQNANSAVAKIDSLNETTTGNLIMPTQIDNYNTSWPVGNIVSKRVPSSGTCLSQRINEEDLHQNQRVLEDFIIRPGKCQTPALDSRSKTRSRKALPWQINKQHHSIDYKPEYFSALLNSNSKWKDKYQDRIQNTIDLKYPSRKIPRHLEESDNTHSTTNSSNWTSQQTNMSNSDSEEYYFPGEIQKQKCISSITGSENDVYSTQSRTQAHYPRESSSDFAAYSWSSSDGSYQLTSQSDDERMQHSFQSSPSFDQVSCNGDSESEGEDYSMYNRPRVRYFPVGSKSKKFSPIRVCKTNKGMNPNKRIGQWKKLKDKLSIIFHHHHHHHHHHHNHPDDDDDPSMGHGKFSSKHRVKTFHPLRTEALGEQALGKQGKSVIHSRHCKNQHNQFNAIVGGLFKHIRHSKESKPSAKQYGKSQQGGKKVLAKLHWWQMLQRHKRVNKLGLGCGKR